MKRITTKTILKQGDKTYQPMVNLDGSIFWEDDNSKTIAQSSHYFELTPVIDFSDFVDNVGELPYTQKDIEKTIELARDLNYYPVKTIVEKINSISVIEIDEYCKVISYE